MTDNSNSDIDSPETNISVLQRVYVPIKRWFEIRSIQKENKSIDKSIEQTLSDIARRKRQFKEMKKNLKTTSNNAGLVLMSKEIGKLTNKLNYSLKRKEQNVLFIENYEHLKRNNLDADRMKTYIQSVKMMNLEDKILNQEDNKRALQEIQQQTKRLQSSANNLFNMVPAITLPNSPDGGGSGKIMLSPEEQSIYDELMNEDEETEVFVNEHIVIEEKLNQ